MSFLVEYPDGLKTMPLISFYEHTFLVFYFPAEYNAVSSLDRMRRHLPLFSHICSLEPHVATFRFSLRVDGVCLRDCLYVAWSLLAFEVLKSTPVSRMVS